MCVMEVNAGQHDSTIAQAVFHNNETGVSDLKMWGTKLVAQGRAEDAAEVEAIRADMDKVGSRLLALYGRFVADIHPHTHLGTVGNERYAQDQRLAARYETRREVTQAEVEQFSREGLLVLPEELAEIWGLNSEGHPDVAGAS